MTLLDLLAAVNAVADVAEPVTYGLVSFVRDFLVVVLAGATFWLAYGRKEWRKWKAARAEERKAEQERRRVEIVTIVSKQIEPLQERVDQTHHQVAQNGNEHDPQTLKDEVGRVATELQSVVRMVTRNTGRIGDMGTKLDDAKAVAVETREEFRAHQDLSTRLVRELADQGIHISIESGDPDGRGSE